ncbi:MAG: ROK family protein [Candidatus Saganbacteria bacterium]|nr:ROK family protein [Candidatus Saganbacteria bacterium]
MKKYIIGVDLGGTKIYTAIADLKGKILKEVEVQTGAKKGKNAVISNICRSVDMALKAEQATLSEIKSIGIGSPGTVNFKEGIVYDPPNLPGWKKVPLKDILKRKFKTEILVDNDANVAALAELKFGAGRGAKNFIYVTISTGIGGGIIIDGKLYRGAQGAAGEVGHMTILANGPKCGCEGLGHLEALASGIAIEKISGLNPIDLEKTIKDGNKEAKKVLNGVIDHLGIGLANLVNIFNPELVVIGGGISNMGELLFLPLRKAVKKYSMPFPGKTVKIVKAKLGKRIGVIGAIALCS